MEWKMQQLTYWPVITVVINKLELLGYILSLVTLTRYVANSGYYNAHYFV